MDAAAQGGGTPAGTGKAIRAIFPDLPGDSTVKMQRVEIEKGNVKNRKKWNESFVWNEKRQMNQE